MEINMNEQLLQISGNIIESNISNTSKGDYISKIKLDSSNNEFSMFGNQNFRTGDFISFEYIKKDIYYNIKNILEYKKLSTVAIPNELDLVIDRLNYNEPKVIAMELAFRYGILKNYEIDEIYALFNRILNTITSQDNKDNKEIKREKEILKEGFWDNGDL
jgi:hypothetical protein